MGRIRFRWFYTELCEHFLRMAVRYKTVSKASSQHWFTISRDWIAGLSEKDKRFIRFVFDRQFYSTAEGLYCYQNGDDMHTKRSHLAELEKDFAIKCGLIDEQQTDDCTLPE